MPLFSGFAVLDLLFRAQLMLIVLLMTRPALEQQPVARYNAAFRACSTPAFELSRCCSFSHHVSSAVSAVPAVAVDVSCR
jgi:hypothetical protein